MTEIEVLGAGNEPAKAKIRNSNSVACKSCKPSCNDACCTSVVTSDHSLMNRFVMTKNRFGQYLLYCLVGGI